MKTILIVVAVLLVVGAASSQFIGREAGGEPVAYAIAPLAPTTFEQSDEAGPEVKLILLALMPEGFESNELRLDPGDYLFIIGNRTGLKEVHVRLERQGVESLAAAAVGGRQRDLKKRLRLTSGTHLVSVVENPDWTCRIVVGR